MVPRHPSYARIRLAERFKAKTARTSPLGYVAFFPRNIQLSKIGNPLKPRNWWRQPDSNRRHPACKAGALPTELCPRKRETRILGIIGPKGVRQKKACAGIHLASPSPGGVLLRKEVIQPLVPQRLPCYDFIPITTHTFDGALLAVGQLRHWVQTAFMM